MVFCSSCGLPVPEAAQFCRACGARQEASAAASPAPAPAAPSPSSAPAGGAPARKARPGGVTAVAVFLILFGIGALFSLSTDGVMTYLYGWTPWLAYNFALALYFLPADFAMAIGLLTGRRWGWKLSVASLCALAFLSIPPVLSGSLLSTVLGILQAAIALPFWLYLASSGRVRAHFGAERVWLHPLLRGGYRPPAQAP